MEYKTVSQILVYLLAASYTYSNTPKFVAAYNFVMHKSDFKLRFFILQVSYADLIENFGNGIVFV